MVLSSAPHFKLIRCQAFVNHIIGSFAIENYLIVASKYHRHSLSRIVEVQNVEQFIFLAWGRPLGHLGLSSFWFFFLVENKLPIVTSLWPFTSIVIVFGVRCLNTKPKFLAADTRAASSGLCAWYSNLHERTEYHFCFIRTSNDWMKCFQLTVHLCSPASRCGTVRVNGKNYEHAPRRPWQRPPNSCRTTWTQARIED